MYILLVCFVSSQFCETRLKIIVSMCEPGAIRWIEVAFNDCIVTSRDKVSFAVGLISNVVFLVSAVPQIVMNFKTKSVDGQSILFLLLLLIGSVFNLVGVLVTKGLITQILTGIFYVLSDGILLTQYILYTYIRKANTISAFFQ